MKTEAEVDRIVRAIELTGVMPQPKLFHPNSKVWTASNGKMFEESFCEHCDFVSITCPVCGLGSCSGCSCKYCNDPFVEYVNGR